MPFQRIVPPTPDNLSQYRQTEPFDNENDLLKVTFADESFVYLRQQKIPGFANLRQLWILDQTLMPADSEAVKLAKGQTLYIDDNLSTCAVNRGLSLTTRTGTRRYVTSWYHSRIASFKPVLRSSKTKIATACLQARNEHDPSY